jgi:hypothetical protein
MPIQKHARTTTTISWADTVNNNAVWNNTWVIAENAQIAVSDLNIPFNTGKDCPLTIEEILFVGTGTPPAKADKEEVQILIAKDSGFTDIVHFGTGLYSDAKFDTTKCIVSFHIAHPIVVVDTDILYCTVKCEGGSVDITASSGRITASQE